MKAAKLPLLLDVGFGNTVPRERVLALVGYDSEPLRQFVQDLEKVQRVIDATRGRKVKTVLVLDNGFAVLSATARETLAERFEGRSYIKESLPDPAAPTLF